MPLLWPAHRGVADPYFGDAATLRGLCCRSGRVWVSDAYLADVKAQLAISSDQMLPIYLADRCSAAGGQLSLLFVPIAETIVEADFADGETLLLFEAVVAHAQDLRSFAGSEQINK